MNPIMQNPFLHLPLFSKYFKCLFHFQLKHPLLFQHLIQTFHIKYKLNLKYLNLNLALLKHNVNHFFHLIKKDLLFLQHYLKLRHMLFNPYALNQIDFSLMFIYIFSLILILHHN